MLKVVISLFLGKRVTHRSHPMSRAGQRWSAVALMLLAGILLAGCAQRDSSAERDRPGGFYGGVSGGMVHP